MPHLFLYLLEITGKDLDYIIYTCVCEYVYIYINTIYDL